MTSPVSSATVLDRKNPILEIAAAFWEEERFEAFRICYRSMREVDDIVDYAKSATRGQPNGGFIGPAQANGSVGLAQAALDNWRRDLARPADEDSTDELPQAVKSQAIPLWPWHDLAKAMAFDLHHARFRSFGEFARYARGAAVAPAAVFVHLILPRALRSPDRWAYRSLARPLALFSYMTHIMRDFRRDYSEGLIYFPSDILAKHKVSPSVLQNAADGQPTAEFTSMAKEYYTLAGRYGVQARTIVAKYRERLEPRYAFSLELIARLYGRIHEKVATNNFDLSRTSDVSDDEVIAIIGATAEEMAVPADIVQRGAQLLGIRFPSS